MLETLLQKGKISEFVMLTITAILTVSYSIIIMNSMAKKKKAIERREKTAIKGETIIITVIVLTSTILSSLSEAAVIQSNTWEKLIWLPIIIIGIKAFPNEKEKQKKA